MQLTFRGRHRFDLSSCNIYCSTRLVCQTFHRHYMSVLLICCQLTKTNFQQMIDRSIDCLETSTTNMMRCAIWYHQHNLKNVKNTHGGALLLDKSNTLPFVFFTFFTWYKQCQITQSVSNKDSLRSQVKPSKKFSKFI